MFFAYYPRLLEWAMQITHKDREEAEDLVHDLYFRITRISRSIDAMESIDSYLFKVIRNLYYSRLHREGRDPLNDLSIVDYDSVEQGLAVADRREMLFARAHLRQICRHVCQRKSAARSASVLILRFFLGYYASELMKILQAPRSSVDRSLQVARSEARLFLERPGALRFISQPPQREVAFSAEGEDTQRLFSELREAIFSATEGPCFPASALERRYAADSVALAFTASELAHLVSCRICLDRVNTILHLPLLAERSPEYGLDRDSTSGPGAGGDAEDAGAPIRRRPSAKGPSLRKIERRARELYEHRPESLQIAVDGEVRASQKVSAEKNELHLKLGRKDEPSFIEVFSEQGFCLAYLDVIDPASPDGLEQEERVALSDDRSLIVTLTFAADVPILHVLYRDPVMTERVATETDSARAEGAVAIRETASVASVPLRGIVLRPGRWIRRRADRVFAWMQVWYQLFVRTMNPFLASAAVFALGTAVCLFLWMRSASPMPASAFLQHAEKAEQAQVPSTESRVISQKVRIRTAAQSIERTIHRDSTGRRKPKRHALDRQTAALEAKLAKGGVNWDEPLSAATYENWREHSQIVRDIVRKTGNNLLTLTTTIDDASVTQESLTVRANDFHPVARTVSFRDTGDVEIAELDYAVMPWSDAEPGWFEPMRAAGSGVNGPGVHPLITAHLAALPLTDAQVDEAELGAMLALHQLRADADNRVQIIRRSSGVQVKGIVEDDARKRELEMRLNEVPHVIPAIFTFAELEHQSGFPAGEGGQNPRPVLESDEEKVSPLEKFLLTKGESRDEMSRLANRLSDSADAVDRESSHLAELIHRYAPDRQQLTEAGRTTLDQLIAERKASILAALDEEEHSLAEAGLTDSYTSDIQKTTLDIEEATKQNSKLCDELVFGDAGHSRSAQDILPELAQTIHQLHAVTLQLSPLPPTRTAPRKEQQD
ncbi:sigma-70 family RNA polymerase sigma factor [Acidipila sp. 4G-K13]|nr:sigma-70 family RNA polymerase sigma factor [Paracidobacterium acidisoli]